MRRSGFTLLELSIVLVLLGLLVTAAVPALRYGRAGLAVRGARAELIAAIATTRAHAVRVGGAQLVVTPAGELRVERADGLALAEPTQLADRYGVVIDTPRNTVVVLHYDALGIGRLTSTTLRLRRDPVAATVTVSAYGRARS